MKDLRELLQDEVVTNLDREVLESVIDHTEGYDEILGYFEDLQRGGCQSGLVCELIYYRDTTAFYERNKEDINDLLYELLDSTGLSVKELFGSKWDDEDPLCIYTSNMNLLSWFAYEETAFKFYRVLEDCLGDE